MPVMAQVHKRFDIEHWIRVFPLAQERARVRAFAEKCERERPGTYTNAADMEDHIRMMLPDGDIIVGPENVAECEQLRAETGPHQSYGPAVPTDVMVWGDAESPHPAGTKLGGCPFRPRSLSWPTGQNGAPSTFLGQICFADSRDILRNGSGAPLDLPGDVLLLFMPNPDGVWDGDDEDPKCMQWEWHTLALTDPMRASDVPEQPVKFAPCYAELHRTWDYPNVPEGHPIRQRSETGRLCVHEGGKIGGTPFYVQEEEPRPGVFLGALGSINPVGPRYPLLNIPVNPRGDHNLNGGHMMFGDCGSLYLFFDQVGFIEKRPQLRWTVQGY